MKQRRLRNCERKKENEGEGVEAKEEERDMGVRDEEMFTVGCKLLRRVVSYRATR